MWDIVSVYYLVGIIGGIILALNATVDLSEKITRFVSTHFRKDKNE